MAMSAACLFAAHTVLERIHHIYCRSNVFLIYLYGDSSYCNIILQSTKSLEAFAVSILGSVLSPKQMMAH
jgi:hypothetical protein